MMALEDPEQMKLLRPQKKKRGKYGNMKIVIRGLMFDSMVEAAHFIVLSKRQENGEIKNLKVKPVYKFRSRIRFVPDFEYVKDGKIVIDDAKGVVTQHFRDKCKLLLDEHGLRVNLIRMDAATARAIVSAAQSGEKK